LFAAAAPCTEQLLRFALQNWHRSQRDTRYGSVPRHAVGLFGIRTSPAPRRRRRRPTALAQRSSVTPDSRQADRPHLEAQTHISQQRGHQQIVSEHCHSRIRLRRCLPPPVPRSVRAVIQRRRLNPGPWSKNALRVKRPRVAEAIRRIHTR
jgi:hypothetical protein